ncbi:unnamed protein product [Kuraishia capsulata CBS 1993]|uniref:Small nuclear ribonucleoprotein G n=1 Tax=Kuraishia capsulata CBS 1993 TaxID=1382522 RepID=W6MNP3_9ASCO|nr:uncharacterized protein KUCA_T00004233001 [Kuraishia capsulata CBS 1993]CDK28251.1 unnamed protein product [Kuraishia capsulata CBS 1993]
MVSAPELKKYMDKKLVIHLNGSRKVEGTLRGYDSFLNLTVEDSVEVHQDERTPLGTSVVRGNSILSIELI